MYLFIYIYMVGLLSSEYICMK
uniref:Uncharacterized protein n=1 Tax=Heterorhabditis bacteriophora TaxID=37862 RepID=A0A1I7XJE6_HETBA